MAKKISVQMKNLEKGTASITMKLAIGYGVEIDSAVFDYEYPKEVSTHTQRERDDDDDD
jgi:hypothetical protein